MGVFFPELLAVDISGRWSSVHWPCVESGVRLQKVSRWQGKRVKFIILKDLVAKVSPLYSRFTPSGLCSFLLAWTHSSFNPLCNSVWRGPVLWKRFCQTPLSIFWLTVWRLKVHVPVGLKCSRHISWNRYFWADLFDDVAFCEMQQ